MLYGYFGLEHIFYLCLYDGYVGYLLHSCFEVLYAKVSGVNDYFT